MATAKSKWYKLGELATLFVDQGTQKKIVGNQVVEFEPHQMRTLKFKEAVKGGHIKETEAPTDGNKASLSEEDAFAKMTKPQMLAKLNEDFDFDESEQKELDGLTKDQLVAKFKELNDEDTE